jgi:hypothetical protein
VTIIIIIAGLEFEFGPEPEDDASQSFVLFPNAAHGSSCLVSILHAIATGSVLLCTRSAKRHMVRHAKFMRACGRCRNQKPLPRPPSVQDLCTHTKRLIQIRASAHPSRLSNLILIILITIQSKLIINR